MRVLIGIDHTTQCRAAAGMVGTLAFESASIALTHVIERFEPVSWGDLPPDAGLAARLLKRQQEDGAGHLEGARAELAAYGVEVAATALRQGFVPNELIAFAREQSAEMIAVGCEGKGNLPGLLYGSVSRKLVVTAPQSLLIVKDSTPPKGKINAVFATDHSDYANRCADLLARFHPRGIDRMTVLTAYPKTLIGAMKSVMDHFKSDVGAWVERQLGEQNAEVIKRLAPLGCEFQSRVIDMAPNAAMEHGMREAEAQLLILGAQGHGFFERLTTGSVSFDQAVKSPFNVMILRL